MHLLSISFNMQLIYNTLEWGQTIITTTSTTTKRTRIGFDDNAIKTKFKYLIANTISLVSRTDNSNNNTNGKKRNCYKSNEYKSRN